MSDPIVSTEWLAERLGRPDVQVVDATWYMPGETGDGRADYAGGHIPGAVFFDIDGVADHTVDLPHMLPTPQDFAVAVGALGLRRDATIVVYDARNMFSAPRVWWTLRVMGFPRVFVLDGGLQRWRAEGRAVEVALSAPTPTQPGPEFHAELVCDVEGVKRRLAKGEAQLVDARSAPRFRGEEPEPRSGVRAGHMPGAKNLPWRELVSADGTLKPAEALRAAFEDAGVDLGQPIVTTCGSGVTAALLALGLARLGREDVPVYDGSWAEWGTRPDTAVATGS